MDKDRFEKGLAMRRKTLGDAYVDKALAEADDFSRPFQELLTEYCWGVGWGDETLSPKTRSMLNLAILAILGRMPEWEIHLRGALRNGVSKAEIAAIITHVSLYAGIPVGVECHRIARRVLSEEINRGQ